VRQQQDNCETEEKKENSMIANLTLMRAGETSNILKFHALPPLNQARRYQHKHKYPLHIHQAPLVRFRHHQPTFTHHTMQLRSGTIKILLPPSTKAKKASCAPISNSDDITAAPFLLGTLLLLLVGGYFALYRSFQHHVNHLDFSARTSSSPSATTNQSTADTLAVVFSPSCTMHVHREHLGFVHFPDVHGVLYSNETAEESDVELIEYGKAKKLCKQLAKTWHPDKVSSQCAGVSRAVFHATQTVCQLGLRSKNDIRTYEFDWAAVYWTKSLNVSDVNSVFGSTGFREAVDAGMKALWEHKWN